MNKTDRKIEIKIPFFIPIIITVIICILSAKIYASNMESITEVVAQTEDVIEIETNNSQNEEIVHSQESENIIEEKDGAEAKTVTYTASNGKQYDVIATLNIPSLEIEYPVLAITSDELLKVSLTKYWGANPNEVGNMVVIGHNYKNSKFFGKLPNIELGAIVKITDLTGKTLDYKVYDTYVIDPYDNACTSQLTDGKTEITLITCYYENGSAHATKRFVVKARAN